MAVAMTTGNTVYLQPVAKVMISFPGELLERLDALAKERGLTRSGLLQNLAERELDALEDEERAEMRRLLELATKPMGGNATKMIREDRNSR
jgi:metal-responsive CopG/Arc/MetJ family transcriptional regulator